MSPGDFDCGSSITSASYHGNLKSVFKLRQMARFYSEKTPKPVLDGGCCSQVIYEVELHNLIFDLGVVKIPLSVQCGRCFQTRHIF